MSEIRQVFEGRFGESRRFAAGSFELLEALLEHLHVVAVWGDEEWTPTLETDGVVEGEAA